MDCTNGVAGGAVVDRWIQAGVLMLDVVRYAELKVKGDWPEERIWKASWAQLEERLASIVQGLAAS